MVDGSPALGCFAGRFGDAGCGAKAKMSEDLIGLSPPLPMPYLLLATLIAVLATAFAAWRTRSKLGWVLFFAVQARYLGGYFHEISFRPSFLGPSWPALFTMVFAFLLVLTVRRDGFARKALLPIYGLAGLALLSGLANQAFYPTFIVILKFTYLAAFMIGLIELFGKVGERKVLTSLLIVVSTALLFQGLSLALGVTKATEEDGSISYIGGYNHEASFSIVMLTALAVGVMARDAAPLASRILVPLCVVGVFFANYRTAMLAAAPLIVAYYVIGVVRRFRPNQRAGVGVFVFALGLAVFTLGSGLMSERFQDIESAWSSGVSPLLEPDEMTKADRKLFSGRLYIWSNYIYGYVEGDARTLWIGAGPEARLESIKKYPHNTLISALYEYGPAGVFTMLSLWISMLIAAIRVKGGEVLVAGHVGFFMLNMSTMPLWLIEGIILYAALCGVTLYRLYSQRPVRSAKGVRDNSFKGGGPRQGPPMTIPLDGGPSNLNADRSLS